MSYASPARKSGIAGLGSSLNPAASDFATQLARSNFGGDSVETTTKSERSEDTGGFNRRVTRQDIIYATAQLAIMTETGINLSEALSGLIDGEKNLRWKQVLLDLKSGIDSGEDFSASLSRFPKHFDRTYVSLIKASESTGALAEMLERIALYLRKELETRSKVRGAMAYPAVMGFVATGVTLFLLTYVLPKFTPLFNRKGMKLPLPTVVMMTLSHWLLDFWYLWLVGSIALTLGFIFGRRTETGRSAWDWFKINAPLVGPMFRKVTISRSIRTLGTMIASGVSMLESLKLCADVSGNYYYEQLWLAVLDRVTCGEQICDVLRGSSLFPPMLVQMISSGEKTGKLDVVLEKVSDYYDQEVDTAIKTCTSMIEPIMITVMGVVVGGIGMALMLPIFSLSRPG